MISIATSTLGRELYIRRQIESILQFGGASEFVHHIVFQGILPSEEMKNLFSGLKEINYPLHLYLWKKVYSTGKTNNLIAPFLKGELVLKLDDDVIIRSPDFFPHIMEINNLIPKAVFAPFPVGLIDNLGGCLVIENRFARYSVVLDTYYTFRKVVHLGGMARITPTEIFKKFKWNDAFKEDVQFSKFCAEKNIPMFYLENSLIVEHQESTIGQRNRYG